MQIVRCPTCGDPLPATEGICARCQAATSASDVTIQPEQEDTPDEMVAAKLPSQAKAAPSELDETVPLDELLPESAETASTIRLPRKAARARTRAMLETALTVKLTRKATQEKREPDAESIHADETLDLKRLRAGARAQLEADISAPDAEEAEDEDDEIITGHGTWQKVVDHKTPPLLPAIALPTPDPRSGGLVAAFRPRWLSRRAFFWLNMLLICALLLAGALSVFALFAHNAGRTATPALQASPDLIALGGILTLHGTQFTPNVQVTLSRDKHISVLDTGGANSVQANARGAFSDTIIVNPSWLPGLHTLYATDTRTHQQFHAPVLVVGQNAVQGPPHLLLSTTSLDFGAGDMATNGSKLLALSNAGGGEITWQASADQSWLQISPDHGTIERGGSQSAQVAVDRSGLAPGKYQATILFTSNTSQLSLVVTMQVIPLQAAHQAVLQLSPATLAFTGSAQGPAPQAQTITVSNPGVRPLSWSASVRMNVGYGWLSISSTGGQVAPGSQQRITVNISTRNLSPAVYQGAITFSNQGNQPVQGSPQSIYVSLTVTPACTLTFGSTQLSFTGTHNQAAPAAQTLHINVAQGCRTSQTWHASVSTAQGGSWLHLNQAQATTPSSPLVSVNSSGLAPGTYTGSLTFTVNTGPQIVLVTLTVNPLPCTVSGPGTLALQGTAGQTGTVGQAITISTGGDCLHSLTWTSATGGTTWLSATTSGSFTQPATASVNEQANLAGLSAGTYTGTVTITVIDNSTKATVGVIQTSVTLTVLPACALQAPSSSTLTFAAGVGTNPATQSFTIGVTGNCNGNATITATTDGGSSSWLAVNSPVSLASGSTATFTVTVSSSVLAAGFYSGTLTLAASDGNGAITGSPQTVSVSLTVS